MITPFTENNQIDYHALEHLIEWFIKKSVNGLFAVCQSSEMYYLSEREHLELAEFVVKVVRERVPIASSGHVSRCIDQSVNHLKAMADTGVDAIVLVTGNIASREESSDVWKHNFEFLLKNLPDIPFGLYECPTPYKRLLDPETLKWCSENELFMFYKDTSCDSDVLKAKLKAVKGTNVKIFNANAATLLSSLQDGVAGYCGVMANFHPSLYRWLVNNWQTDLPRAQKLQNFLGLASVIEMQCYPKNAKYYCRLNKLPMSIYTRNPNCPELKQSFKREVEQLHALTLEYLDQFINHRCWEKP